MRVTIQLYLLLLASSSLLGQSITDVENYTIEDELPSNYVQEIIQDGFGYIWVTTSEGTVRFNGYDFNRLSKLDSINVVRSSLQQDLIIFSEVEAVFLKDKEITTNLIDAQGSHWFGTRNSGLFYVLNPNYNSEAIPEIYFEFVGLNNKRFENPEAEITISPDFETLSIGYVTLNYPQKGRINYRYKIEGIHEDWIDTREKKMQFTALPDRGEFIFMVKAQSRSGVWGQPKSITLRFLTPYYKSWWFISLCVAFILFFFWAFIRWFFKRRLRLKALEAELQSLEGKALQSQMNPHFVFNSLNSIQSFIATGDTMKSEIYLSKFSNLLRKTLNNSRTTSVTLVAELENIQTYLELEKMRFEDRLRYEIIVDNDVEQDLIEIAPMIIQPFIENAIVHGIGPKKEGGVIQIHISAKNNNALRCVITDNGIGRGASTIKEHHSLGTAIVTKRLSLLSHEVEGTITYTDLKNLEQEPTGTKVELIIPIRA